MVLKKGVSTKDLRPFSIEDPHGLGIVSPTQERLRERFQRKGKGRSRTTKHPRVPAAAERRTAQTARFQPTTHTAVQPRRAPRLAKPKKKSKGVGCFTTLIILGALYAAGQLFIPLIWSAVMQEYVLQTGQSAQGQILSAQATSSKWNDNTVYEITLDVHAPGLQPYQVSIKQALSAEQAARLTPGVWAELRYDSNDLENVALFRVGIPDPRAVSQQENLPQQDQVIDQHQTDAAQIIADLHKRTDALSKLPGTRPPHTDGSDPPAHTGAPSPAPASASSQAPKKETLPDSRPSTGTPSPPTPTPAVVPASKPAESTPLACLQATACCKIAQGKACASFSSPGTEERSCKRALRNFSKAAETAGKSCSDLPQ